VISENTDTVFVALRVPAEGRYIECLVTYRAVGQQARLRDGTAVTLEVADPVQRMPITGAGLQQRAGARSWLALRHSGDADA
jgi:hypothetical protein